MRQMALVLLLSMLVSCLSGCWDNRELDALFVVTGVALDAAQDPEQINIALQIGKPKEKTSGSGDSSSQAEATIMQKTTSDTLQNGMNKLNQDSSRTLFLHHNQAVLIGKSLAEQGVKKRIDMFMRDHESRMEVLVLVVDGRAEEVLTTEMDQEKISGMFLSRMMRDLYEISPYYRVRMLDFASWMIDDTTAPLVPIIKLEQSDKNKSVQISGMAVFGNDRMIGRISDDDTLGYLWNMGHVKRSAVECTSDSGKAVFIISTLNSKKDIRLTPDGNVQVNLSVDAVLGIGEIIGFESLSPLDLMPNLVELSKQEIKDKITNCIETSKKMDADIFGIGTAVYRRYPKQWRELKQQWHDIYPNIEWNVDVKVHLPATGQTIKTLEMEESSNEN